MTGRTGPGLRDLTATRGLLYGGDYNPEQWPAEIVERDVELMVAAGVNLVTVGVFSWSRIEPGPGVRDFDWLDRVLDLLAGAGIAVALATPTASPPPWLAHDHPDTLPVTADGVRLSQGSRNHFCPSSPTYRAHALEIATDVVARYADHPAVAMWHVGNEFGQVCHCDQCAAGFRHWLRNRYDDLTGLNSAWATTFWSQAYGRWEEIVPPRAAPYMINPTQRLDYRRFCSDTLLELYTAQRDMIRAVDPSNPITTNFMGFFPHVDYWSWAGELDVISDDSYPDPVDPDAPVLAALSHDLMRSLAGGPWLLMEQAVSAVNWREHNPPKSPGRMRADALRAVAHGSDGVLSFQWRASAAGAERFHSAMLPHAGPDTRLHRSVRALGADLAALAPVAGSRIRARVAIAFDWSSWWAAEEPGGPSARLRVLPQVLSWYRPLWRRGLATDLVQPEADLTSYDLVLAPQLHLVTDAAVANLRAFTGAGGTLALGPFSGVADADAAIRPGAFPAPFTDLLGAGGEEWCPLPDGGAALVLDGHRYPVHTWAERLVVGSADVLATFAGADLDGAPAAVRSPDGRLLYLAAVGGDDLLEVWVATCLDAAGVTPSGIVAQPPPGVELAVRGEHTFLFNHTGAPVSVPLTRASRDMLTGTDHPHAADVPADGSVVLIERQP
ncbi:beta-galactosidase [Occultella kanbiaonis]|uniref:beta-galactosidase n=1 Tax=Occultella kanbiaonis TaxID=2675754 RepID=UPI001B357CEB|nr:beta-galactosidase [Occultella kanbiaonis]